MSILKGGHPTLFGATRRLPKRDDHRRVGWQKRGPLLVETAACAKSRNPVRILWQLPRMGAMLWWVRVEGLIKVAEFICTHTHTQTHFKNFLEVQWLRLCVSTAGGMGLITGWGTKVLHATLHGHFIFLMGWDSKSRFAFEEPKCSVNSFNSVTNNYNTVVPNLSLMVLAASFLSISTSDKEPSPRCFLFLFLGSSHKMVMAKGTTPNHPAETSCEADFCYCWSH